ncbi:MAG: TA system VapC family ribonuclease toxin [Acidimicrobiales bacterium]
MRALLVNVLVALLDRLASEIGGGWASCPITENGFVRVISQPRYPNPIPPAEAISLPRREARQPHHQFWACDLSVLDAAVVDQSRLHGPRQVTDAYLLALATKHEGRFVTFDQSISLAVVKGARADNLVVV